MDELVETVIVGLCARARGKRVAVHGLGDQEGRQHNCMWVVSLTAPPSQDVRER